MSEQKFDYPFPVRRDATEVPMNEVEGLFDEFSSKIHQVYLDCGILPAGYSHQLCTNIPGQSTYTLTLAYPNAGQNNFGMEILNQNGKDIS